MFIYSGKGEGFVNNLINKLPVELHIPGYQYCGPGTKLEKRLKRGDQGINPLDKACRVHDIAYQNFKSLEERHKADKELEEAAWSRVKSKDASLGEKTASWFVTSAMKTKRKVGVGFNCLLKEIENALKTRKGKGFKRRGRKGKKGESVKPIINFALSVAKRFIKRVGGRKKVQVPRIIPVPKQGGVIPFIPIFAALSALGALAGGSSQIAKAVKDAQHNKAMEAIAASKGKALYLKPYRKGRALFLKPYKKGKAVSPSSSSSSGKRCNKSKRKNKSKN